MPSTRPISSGGRIRTYALSVNSRPPYHLATPEYADDLHRPRETFFSCQRTALMRQLGSRDSNPDTQDQNLMSYR